MQEDVQSRGRVLWLLFWEFFKIATFVVGGGLAILVAADDLFAKKYHWLKENELPDTLALVQAVPGLTAGNVAIYIGYKMCGVAGAFCGLCGVAMPSFLIITLVAMGFHQIPIENIYVQGAFLGVRTAVMALSLSALMKVWKTSLRDLFQWLVLIGGAVAILFFRVAAGWIVLTCVLLGPIYCLFVLRRLPKSIQGEK